MGDDVKLEEILSMSRDELYTYAQKESIDLGVDINSLLSVDANYQEVCDFFADYIDPKLKIWLHSDYAWLSD